MDYEFHPLAEAFQMMDSGDIDKLAKDIRANGQIVPAYLLGGKILDGRNRYMACTQLGIPLTVTNCEDEEDYHDDPVAFVASLNLHRRHMTPVKRDEAIVELRKQGKSYRQIAAAVGVDPKTAYNTVERSTVKQPKEITGKDGRKQPSTRKRTVRDSHSETTEEPAGQSYSADGIPLDESTGELTPAETSQAIVDSFLADMARWSERLNKIEIQESQVEQCAETVARFLSCLGAKPNRRNAR